LPLNCLPCLAAGKFRLRLLALDNPRVQLLGHEQPAHHKKRAFEDEYRALLRAYDAAHEEQHLFGWSGQPSLAGLVFRSYIFPLPTLTCRATFIRPCGL
jgi:hypothetical protein